MWTVEKPLLGRGLTVAEVRYVTETARRIAALIALQKELDANYAATAGGLDENSEVLELYDRNDIDGYYERGKAHAAELARLLEPKGVKVTFCGESIAARER